MINLLDAKVALIKGEIVDGEGIFDILVINVCSLIQHLQFDKYLILVLFYEKRACHCMDGKRCNRGLMATKTVDGQQDFTKTSIIGLYLEY